MSGSLTEGQSPPSVLGALSPGSRNVATVLTDHEEASAEHLGDGVDGLVLHGEDGGGALPAEDEVAAWPYAQLLELDGEPLTSNWFRGVAGNRAKALVRDLYESDFALYTYSRDDVPSG